MDILDRVCLFTSCRTFEFFPLWVIVNNVSMNVCVQGFFMQEQSLSLVDNSGWNC